MPNDELYSGYRPMGNEDLPQEVAEETHQQEAELLKIMPYVELVSGIIAKEREAIADLRAYIKTLGDNPDADSLIAEYRARELYMGFLDRLEGTVADGVALLRKEHGE